MVALRPAPLPRIPMVALRPDPPRIPMVALRPDPLLWIPMAAPPQARPQDSPSAAIPWALLPQPTAHRQPLLPSAAPRPPTPPSQLPLVECTRPWALPLPRMVRWELRPTAT
jgi:hypothetical protein